MAAQYHYPDAFQQKVEAYGSQLTDIISSASHTQLNQFNWLDQLIKRTSSDNDFRIQALRFIDVLPSLQNDHALARHLQEYFSDLDLPRFAEWGLKYTDTGWATRIAAPTIRYTLRGLARKFMGGNKLHHAMSCISRLRHDQMNFTLDLLGEATISDNECEEYKNKYLEILSHLSEPVNNWNNHSLLDISHAKPSPRLNLSIKLSSLYSQISKPAPQDSINAICERLRPVLRSAIKHNAFITIDMEQYDFKHIVLGCFRQIIMEDEFKSWPHIGLAMQAYLKDTYQDITDLLELLKKRTIPVTIRLVRGAYWDYESVIATQNNWACPVWKNKCDTDLNYEKCICLLLQSNPLVHTAIATHNPRSIAYSMALIDQLNLNKDQFEFQMLYGMADYLKPALIQLGYRLRIYVPFGETLPGMAYLVRRLLENSSGQSILDSGFGTQSKPIHKNSFYPSSSTKKSIQLKSVNQDIFINCSLLRFSNTKQCSDFKTVINKTENKLGESYPLIINGKEIFTENKISSFNPANPLQLVGTVSSANHKLADEALDAANKKFNSWSKTSARTRADYLRRVASLLSKRRMEFAAWQIFEAGKNWQEADGDVCEAIDFLNYYALQAEKILNGKNINISGEINHINYRACGVCLIISPWNFPLAILCGMLSAAIVTGNTCILKPSSLTPVIAARFMQLWQEVDLPDGVINFLPGSGEIVGEYLAKKTNINIISFTGSQQVGTHLLEIAAKTQPKQKHIKKVISEMGGKNAIIVDSDADLDDAVLGVVHSAFCFQGQKCSATSRVIVVGEIYTKFIKRLIETTNSLTIGPPDMPFNLIGPVIDKRSYDRIIQIIKLGQKTATLHNYDAALDIDDGYYIKPCIFTDVDPLSPLAQEEIFGPVLSVIKAEDFISAVDIANNTPYALTGGVYSRQPSHLEYSKNHFQVGNLYLNRQTTGAMVNRQPFGGFKMSGVGNKAGGENYLHQFMNAYCITENTLRRGFAPDANN